MPTNWLASFSRLTAGALLFQTTAPVTATIKDRIDAQISLKRTLERASAPPAPMLGVPIVKSSPTVAPSNHLSSPHSLKGPGRTLLDREGYLRDVTDASKVPAWRAELAVTSNSVRKARLLIQIGETRLDAHEPREAQGLFERAASILPQSSPDRGLARFDAALSLYFQGRFRAARLAFEHVAVAKLRGVDHRWAALYSREAAACEGYHAQNEAMGIPEPPFLDPLCGVAALATCLRDRGMAYDKSQVLARVRHDGEGSDTNDLLAGLPRLGLVGREVMTDEKGLRALPKPLVAHVEHDHFVAVVDADKDGVEYVCSDCGAWPGGPVRLTWKQWRALSADGYLAVAKPGTAEALALDFLPTRRDQGPGRILLSATRAQNPGLIATAERILHAIGTSAIGQGTAPVPAPKYCGMRPNCDHCTPGRHTPVQSCPVGGKHGTGDPVNLATAEEEYEAPADLRVYNPTGPSISWGLSYYSLADVPITGFGAGWTHPYNYRIVEGKTMVVLQPGGPPTTGGGSTTSGTGGGGTTYTKKSTLVLPNSARITLVLDPNNPPSATNPVQHVSLGGGYTYMVDWCYDSTTSSTYYMVTEPDRTRWSFTPVSGNIYCPTKIADRVGNFVKLNWSTFTYGTIDGENFSYTNPGLVSVVDSSNQALLTLNYTSNSRVGSVSDRYGRSVLYTVAQFSQGYVPADYPQYCDELTDISQIVATGATSAPVRCHYGYENHGNNDGGETVPFLHTIAVPSPTGTGMSTATINYNTMGQVSDSVDANGNKTVYTPVVIGTTSQANATRVQIKSPAGALIYQADRYWDNLMSETKQVNANGQTVAQWVYADPNDPFGPSSATDGNGRVWNLTYDHFGNTLTESTPKGTTTTYTYSYANFALGEMTSARAGSKTATTYTYYEPSGLLHEEFSPIPGEVGTGATQAKTYWYDSVGNLTHVATPGNNASASRSVYYGYTTDVAVPGDPAGTSYSQLECLDRPITVTDSNGKVVHFRYDDRGNKVSVTDSTGNQSGCFYNLADQATAQLAPATGTTGSGRATQINSFLYVGGPLTQIDSKNESGTTFRTVTTTYGPEGETLSTLGSTESLTLSYDALYQTKTVKDGNNNVTSYTYDTCGHLIQKSLPGATGANYDQIKFTSYDAANNLLSRTDGNGQVVNYTYNDADGLLTNVSYPGTTGNNVSLSYDAYGRRVSRTDAAGSYAWRYDDLDERTGEDTSYTGISTQTVSFAYWPDGSRKTLTLPAGRAYGYTYDADGRCTGMTLYGSATGPSFAYYDNGREASRTMPNGLTTNYSYNAIGLLNGVVNTVGSTTVSQYGGFGYDGAFNLGSVTVSVPSATAHSGTTTYGYDAKDRLTSESSTQLGGYGQTNAYDAAGNPTTLRGSTATFNANNQRTGTGFVYDGNGAPTTYNGVAQAYDVEGRMTTRPSWSAVYRADGLRGWKDWQGARKYYLYVDGKSWMEVNSTSQPDAINVWAPDGLVGRRQGASWEYYAYDPQGNVAQRTDGSGAVLSSSVYDGYGAETYTGTRSEIFGYNARWGYVADRETGLYYCQHRYYDPARGRWVTRDPMGSAGGVNVYGYGASGPVGGADPSGYGFYVPSNGNPVFRYPRKGPGGQPVPFPDERLPEAGDRPHSIIGQDAMHDRPGYRGYPKNRTFPTPGSPVPSSEREESDHGNPGPHHTIPHRHGYPDPGDCTDRLRGDPDISVQPEDMPPPFWRIDNPWAWGLGAVGVAACVAAPEICLGVAEGAAEAGAEEAGGSMIGGLVFA